MTFLKIVILMTLHKLIWLIVDIVKRKFSPVDEIKRKTIHGLVVCEVCQPF
jgi:hypothetical protein